tara:strand:+ start:1779 stop:2462 length:684 start_codon:yes stop_codon:yes gene_type:complete
MDIESLSQELSQFLDEGGILLGLPIAGLSLLLFLAGYRLLPIVTMIVGIAIGYVSSPLVLPIASDLGIDLDPLQITAIICLGCGIVLSGLVTLSARLLTSAFIFITFSTGIQTLNNYGFDVERSELWSGIAALFALFFTMGINKILPAIFAAVFAAYGFIVAGLLVTGNQVSTFEPVEVKTFILMLPIVVLSILMQNLDKVKQEEKALAKHEPDAKTKEAQQHFLKL